MLLLLIFFHLLSLAQADASTSSWEKAAVAEKKRIEERVRDFEYLQKQKLQAGEGYQEKVQLFKKQKAQEAEVMERIRLKQVLERGAFGGYPEDLPIYADYLKALTALEAEREKVRQDYVHSRVHLERALATVPNIPEEVELDLVQSKDSSSQQH